MLDANPADSARPAGLRNGVAALTASNAADFTEAMTEDIAALIAATTAISAAPPVLIASPTRALLMSIRAPHGLAPLVVLGSSAINAADLICVQPAALAAAVGAIPQITASTEATLHFSDAPLAIVGGSPAVVAAPVMSLFQGDKLALKVRYPISWVTRDSRAVSWLTTKW